MKYLGMKETSHLKVMNLYSMVFQRKNIDEETGGNGSVDEVEDEPATEASNPDDYMYQDADDMDEGSNRREFYQCRIEITMK